MQRYDRQIRLEGFGEEKQRQLGASSALVIGAGGLGVPVLQYLTAMGIGKVGIVEQDNVSITNLQRQVIYTMEDEGKPKLQAAVKRLQQLNPEVDFVQHPDFLMPGNALDVIAPYDIVIDCTDNFGTRYLVNDACVILNKPFIYGAIYKYEGQVSVFNYKGSATYRCLFPEAPQAGDMLNCSEIGVLGVLPGIVGTYQANEAVKVLCGIGVPLANQLLTIDTLYNTHHIFEVKPVPGNHSIEALLPDYEQGLCNTRSVQSLSVQQLQQWLDTGKQFRLLDVREMDEWEICHIPQASHIPMRAVMNALPQLQLSPGTPVVILCHHGMRSLMVAQQLAAAGFDAVYNVEGGIHAWAQEIDEEMMTY
ncbi:HesA/MoeB/ThiF family protein [uncultured Chitinophaga sp.]|jgi:Dinucleotide-utilizing enzymes involved in molybdopterin and thiamine biosynthesis family 2|uniref:HesA/MoeB/ThiF family protein n=1 Tax=uncultured Chitinophaga sp. TaxID=339340 RepID=UPI00260D5C6F|nr:HesA/MoeB/ThiF family protein [uncultured Chitinophaga sp.]